MGKNNGATDLVLGNNYALSTIPVNGETVTGSASELNGADKNAADFQASALFSGASNWSPEAWSIDATADNTKAWTIWNEKSYPYLQIQSATVATITSQANGVLTCELRNNAEKVVVTAENGTVLKTETSVTAGEKTITIPGLANNTPVIFTVYEAGKIPSYPVKAVYISGGTNITHIKTGKLNVYPSLVEQSLTVAYSNESAPESIAIYDSTGKQLGTYTANPGKTTLNLSSLASGHYILKAGNSVARFVKK